MIQRIQSIFLFLSSVCFWLVFSFPFATSDFSSSGFLSDSVFNVFDHTAFIILAAAGGAISLVTIFLFNNRKLQTKLTNLTIVLAILLPLIVILLFLGVSPQLDSEVEIKDRLGAYLPVGSIIFAAIARKYIRKDEKLVRSMDRLR